MAFESSLRASPTTVWAAVARMDGVNEELRPLVRMTFPRGAERLASDNQVVMRGFRSWVLLLGVIPIDRHRFGFAEIVDGASFSEASSSWLNRSWKHRREVSQGATAGESILRDELEIEPRLRLVAPLIHIGVTVMFRHRHRRLRKRFGQAP